MVEIIYHFPPELTQQLIDAIPLLCRSKRDVVLFFRGAGTPSELCSRLECQLTQDRDSLNKYEIARIVLTHLNEGGEQMLRVRREVLKRVVEFEDFSRCWPADYLKAKGLVAEIQRVVNVKDSFTRMAQERAKERQRAAVDHEKEAEIAARKREALESIKRDFFSLFAITDAKRRGVLLESVLNRLFRHFGIQVREGFRRTGDASGRVLEQIDAVVELDGEIYLVEMKWLSDPVSVDDVSRHLVRIYHRGSARGIFISATEFTAGSLEICKEALQRTVVTLVLLSEIVAMLESGADLTEFLRRKLRGAQIDKNPFCRGT